MTGPFLGSLAMIMCGGLMILTAAALRRATRGIGYAIAAAVPASPTAVIRPHESPESIAAKLCRTLAVQAAEMRLGTTWHTEWVGLGETRRVEVRQHEVHGETAYVVSAQGIVRHVVPDLHAVEAAVAHEINRWRRASDTASTGVVIQ